jgi:hypothetical protein
VYVAQLNAFLFEFHSMDCHSHECCSAVKMAALIVLALANLGATAKTVLVLFVRRIAQTST